MKALAAALLVATTLGAGCSGESRPRADTATTAPPAGATGSTGAAATGAAGTGTAMPATGKTWDVKMIGDGTSYRFEPKSLTIKAGDAVRWTVVSGPPHDVAFWPDSIPAGAATQLSANMPNQMSPLSGQLLNGMNETYVISFAGVPPGRYPYYCTPHLALGMVAEVKVQ